MYKLHLILKYLRKRRIAWVSLIAVMLCTAMVLVVISVMGGWLRMFNESFHSISGDIIVHGQSELGFPDYELMMEKMKGLRDEKGRPIVIAGTEPSPQGTYVCPDGSGAVNWACLADRPAAAIVARVRSRWSLHRRGRKRISDDRIDPCAAKIRRTGVRGC